MGILGNHGPTSLAYFAKFQANKTKNGRLLVRGTIHGCPLTPTTEYALREGGGRELELK